MTRKPGLSAFALALFCAGSALGGTPASGGRLRAMNAIMKAAGDQDYEASKLELELNTVAGLTPAKQAEYFNEKFSLQLKARDNQIAALFLYNRARLDLWKAMGKIRQMVD